MNNGNYLMIACMIKQIENIMGTLCFMMENFSVFDLDENDIPKLSTIRQNLTQDLCLLKNFQERRADNLDYSGEKKETEYKPEEG